MFDEKKNGGPYNETQRNEFKEKIFELCFEKGISAVRAAKILGINRNTVNNYIKSWCQELRGDMKLDYYRDWFDRILSRLEFQQSRLELELQKDLTLKEKLSVEKAITQQNMYLANLIEKVEKNRHYMNFDF
jgi:transposase-like protein